MSHSCLYIGQVRHRRRAPQAHRFGFQTYMLWLDLDELSHVFRGRWLWSAVRPAVAWFRDRDHLIDLPAELSLRQKVLLALANHGIDSPVGPIRLLTQLRHFGFVMNPVNFFYCFDLVDEKVVAIIAEVNNTPWGEQHLYVVPGNESNETVVAAHLQKEFHVSPFMPMGMQYRMNFTQPGERVGIKIENFKNGNSIFQATLLLRKHQLTTANLNWVLFRYPWISLQIFLGIYWQAIRMYLKRLPVYRHPVHIRQRFRPMEIESVPSAENLQFEETKHSIVIER